MQIPLLLKRNGVIPTEWAIEICSRIWSKPNLEAMAELQAILAFDKEIAYERLTDKPLTKISTKERQN